MDHEIVIELIKVLPTLIWALIVVGIVIAFFGPVKTQLLPRMTELKAFGVEAAFVKTELDKAAATGPAGPEISRDRVARRAQRIAAIIKEARVLLVNDAPEEMRHVIAILESLGVRVVVRTDSRLALLAAGSSSFDAVISDMERGAVPDEGLKFLAQMRDAGHQVPIIFTVGNFQPDRGTPPHAFGITNRVDELLHLVFDVLERTRG